MTDLILYSKPFETSDDAIRRQAVLDKIRAEIDEEYDKVHPYDILIAEGLERALDIIDKYKAEGSKA